MKNKKIIVGISALVIILVLVFFTIILTTRKSSSSSGYFKKDNKIEYSTQKKHSIVRSSQSYSKTSVSSTAENTIVKSSQSTQIAQSTEAALSYSEKSSESQTPSQSVVIKNAPMPSSNEQSEQPTYSTTAPNDLKYRENQQKLEAGRQKVRDYFSELNKTNDNKYPLDKVESTIDNFFKFINFDNPNLGTPDEQINLRSEQATTAILNGTW